MAGCVGKLEGIIVEAYHLLDIKVALTLDTIPPLLVIS